VHGLFDGLPLDTEGCEPGGNLGLAGQCQEEMFGADEAVVKAAGLNLAVFEHLA
jgi:hypothetical protein